MDPLRRDGLLDGLVSCLDLQAAHLQSGLRAMRSRPAEDKAVWLSGVVLGQRVFMVSLTALFVAMFVAMTWAPEWVMYSLAALFPLGIGSVVAFMFVRTRQLREA